MGFRCDVQFAALDAAFTAAPPGPQAAVKALKSAVDVLKANPDMLHLPQLAFFKEYLESLGASVPVATRPLDPPPLSISARPGPPSRVPLSSTTLTSSSRASTPAGGRGEEGRAQGSSL